MLKKIVVSVLALSVAASTVLFSCNSAPKTADNTTAAPAATTALVPATSAVIPFPHDTRDFGGATFNVLIDTEPVNQLDVNDFQIEGQTGEELNDAEFKRDTYVEETFNVQLAEVHDKNITSTVPKLIKSGDATYDMLTPRLMNAATFAMNGYGVNVLNQSDLTLSAPWWDQNITKETSVGGTAYFLNGDIFTEGYDGASMMIFNKTILQNYGLESPYQYVADNQWTMDNFNAECKPVTKDLNGDGKMSYKDDQYGLSTQADYLSSMVNGSGQFFVTKDSNDLPVFNTAADDQIQQIVNKMLDVYANYTYCIHRDANAASMSQFFVFPQGRALYFWALTRYIGLGLRDMTDDFGIVPVPKWDSNQTSYYSTMNAWHMYTVMIPKTVADPTKSAYLMDALAYYGRQDVTPAYYDDCLQRKYTRDNESAGMLDIIFSSTCYDLARVYDFGTYMNTIEADMYKTNSVSIATEYAKLQTKIDSDIAKTISNFQTNAG